LGRCAAWGALELATGDGAWHGVAWAPDETALLARLQRRYASLRGTSPLCLVIRALQPLAWCPPNPGLRPGRSGTFREGRKGCLHHYAPWFAQGIPRPWVDAELHRFILNDETSSERPTESRPIEIRQIVSFYEGWTKTHAAAVCQEQERCWQLTAVP